MNRKQVGVLVMFILAYAFVNPRFTKTVDTIAIQTDALRLPKPEALQISTLNYRTLGADFAWVISLVGRGEDVRKKRESGYYLQNGYSVTRIDPFFRKAYDLYPAIFLQASKSVSHQDLMDIADFLDLGIERFPADPELVHQAGLVFLGYSADREPTLRIIEVERAIGYFTRASKMPGAHETTPALLSYFTRRLAQLSEETQEPIWSSDDRELLVDMYLSHDDPKFGEYILRTLTEIGADAESIRREKERIVVQIEERKTQEGLSYVPGGLYWTVADRE